MRAAGWLLGAVLLLGACHWSAADLRRRASAGEPRAQYEYGRCLLTGQRGLPRDASAALPWLQAAAQSGLPQAQRALGLCYERGLGAEASVEQARRCYAAAAGQGDAVAAMACALLELRTGHRAAALWRLRRWADEEELPQAQLLLGMLGLEGTLGRDSAAEGVRYLRYAAMQGSGQACLLMALCYARGLGVPRDEGLARGWLQNAAALGAAQDLPAGEPD